MLHQERVIRKKISSVTDRMHNLESVDRMARKTNEYKQLQVYLDQLTRELDHYHEMEHREREQQTHNFGL
jgi:hypothetical protein